jgi:hypothetical protein
MFTFAEKRRRRTATHSLRPYQSPPRHCLGQRTPRRPSASLPVLLLSSTLGVWPPSLQTDHTAGNHRSVPLRALCAMWPGAMLLLQIRMPSRALQHPNALRRMDLSLRRLGALGLHARLCQWSTPPWLRIPPMGSTPSHVAPPGTQFPHRLPPSSSRMRCPQRQLLNPS